MASVDTSPARDAFVPGTSPTAREVAGAYDAARFGFEPLRDGAAKASPTPRSGGRGARGATTRRTRRWTRAMALNREFYAACFARSALGRTVATETKSSETSFAAAAKKEFDLTSFLKDLAAVRARDATARGWARAIASG